MNLASLQSKYRAQILDIAEACQVEEIKVFGSIVRGTFTSESDIDF
ncbi:MAG: nucleotidyltransferase domain-containing protein [Pseudomonadota bacterium]